MANIRSNVFIEHKGLRMHVSEWSRQTGIELTTILNRIKEGRTTDEIFSTGRLKRRWSVKPKEEIE